MLPKVGLALIYGQAKSGKSFWTHDLVMHIARGIDYRGHDVVAGCVVYIAAEGGAGFRKRIEAYRRKHAVKDADFYLCAARPDLAIDAPVIISDIKRQLGEKLPACIVLDTLNRTLVGSENKPEDMSRYLRSAGMIQDAFKCLVVVVHHTGVEQGRPRGHTSLTAAADAQIAITETFTSKLEVVDLGYDNRGNEVSTCVIVPVEGIGIRKREKPLPEGMELAKRSLAMICDHGETRPDIPAGLKGVPEELWRQDCYRQGIGGDVPDSRRKAFNRNKEGLMVRGFVGSSNGWCWLGPGPNPDKRDIPGHGL